MSTHLRLELGAQIGRVEVDDLDDIFLEVVDSSYNNGRTVSACVELTPKQARATAKALIDAAKGKR